MSSRLARSLAVVLLLAALHGAAAPPKKKKGTPAPPPTPAQVEPELKAAPPLQPVAAEPAFSPPPAQPSPPPPQRVAASEPELAPLPKISRRAGLSVQATGGILVPFSSLGVGGRADLRAAYWLESIPLALSLGVAFEQHTSRTPTFFAPPAGGFDPAALDNQTLLPFELGVLAAPFRDDKNRVHLGVSYALLTVWSQTLALGGAVLERGVGQEIAGEAGYTRRLGALELTVRLRYSVRKTAVGARSSSLELPWYQTFGVLAGLGFWL